MHGIGDSEDGGADVGGEVDRGRLLVDEDVGGAVHPGKVARRHPEDVIVQNAGAGEGGWVVK